jgi:UDP-N-acetylglucosamine acyltransferase
MIHKTSIIGKNVKIEKGVEIGPYCIIGDNTHIMKGTRIYSHAVVGTDPEHLGLDPASYDKSFTTIIGENTTIREFATVNAGMPGDKTTIGDNCYIMTKSHIGHDSKISDNCVISSGAKIGGHSTIGSFTYIGLNATTHQRSIIGSYCMVGAQSFYKGQFKVDGVIWAGLPAIPKKVNFVNIQKNSYNFEELNKKAKKFIKEYKNEQKST